MIRTKYSSLRRRFVAAGASLLLAAAGFVGMGSALADDKDPNLFIERLSTEVLGKIRSDPGIKSGDFSRISTFVDETIMPHVNFERMTALAVGRGWRNATPEQRAQLTQEFRTLLLRTYSGALTQVRDESVRMRPLRAAESDKELIVRSDIVGRGEPIQLNYRLERDGQGWKIFDLNVLGVWLIETYRNQFNQIVNNSGVDGLIKTLADKNKQYAGKT